MTATRKRVEHNRDCLIGKAFKGGQIIGNDLYACTCGADEVNTYIERLESGMEALANLLRAKWLEGYFSYAYVHGIKMTDEQNAEVAAAWKKYEAALDKASK